LRNVQLQAMLAGENHIITSSDELFRSLVEIQDMKKFESDVWRRDNILYYSLRNQMKR